MEQCQCFFIFLYTCNATFKAQIFPLFLIWIGFHRNWYQFWKFYTWNFYSISILKAFWNHIFIWYISTERNSKFSFIASIIQHLCIIIMTLDKVTIKIMMASFKIMALFFTSARTSKPKKWSNFSTEYSFNW